MADEKRDMLYSTDDIWLGEQSNRCLTDVVDDMYSKIDFFPDNYAVKEHNHSEYAMKTHNHDESYYKKSEVDDMIANLKSELAQMIVDAIAEKDSATSDTEDSATEDTSSATDNTESSSE